MVTITKPKSTYIKIGSSDDSILTWQSNISGQNAYEILYRLRGASSWNTTGKTVGTGTSYDLKNICNLLPGFEYFKEIEYKVRLYHSTSNTSGALIGTDESDIYKLVFTGTPDSYLKVNGGGSYPLFSNVTNSGQKLKVRRTSSQTLQTPLIDTTNPLATNVRIKVETGIKTIPGTTPRFNPVSIANARGYWKQDAVGNYTYYTSYSYVNGYYYSNYQYSYNYSYRSGTYSYDYISSYYKDYAAEYVEGYHAYVSGYSSVVSDIQWSNTEYTYTYTYDGGGGQATGYHYIATNIYSSIPQYGYRSYWGFGEPIESYTIASGRLVYFDGYRYQQGGYAGGPGYVPGERHTELYYNNSTGESGSQTRYHYTPYSCFTPTTTYYYYAVPNYAYQTYEYPVLDLRYSTRYYSYNEARYTNVSGDTYSYRNATTSGDVRVETYGYRYRSNPGSYNYNYYYYT